MLRRPMLKEQPVAERVGCPLLSAPRVIPTDSDVPRTDTSAVPWSLTGGLKKKKEKEGEKCNVQLRCAEF